MAQAPSASQQTVLAVNQLLFGHRLYNESFANQVTYTDRFGEAAYATALTMSLRGQTDVQVATTMVKNAGIANAGVVAYVAAVLGAFGAEARGQVAINLANRVATLENDANFGADAVRFKQQIAADFVFSNDPGNRSPIGTTNAREQGADPMVAATLAGPSVELVGQQQSIDAGWL